MHQRLAYARLGSDERTVTWGLQGATDGFMRFGNPEDAQAALALAPEGVMQVRANIAVQCVRILNGQVVLIRFCCTRKSRHAQHQSVVLHSLFNGSIARCSCMWACSLPSRYTCAMRTLVPLRTRSKA